MGKKKFIDKKKSATFHLMARDTSDPNYSSEPSGDRIFVRVDNNLYTQDTFNDDESNSIFADAVEDDDDDDDDGTAGGVSGYRAPTMTLSDQIRKEILELGFPDDGYNYLTHLREIKNTGGGSAYYENPKASFDLLPQDVKAYDASRVDVSKITDVSEEKSIPSVASKTVGVRLQKALDPEVAAILDHCDSSEFGSDVEDLEEDFVIQANFLEGAVDGEPEEKLNFSVSLRVDDSQSGLANAYVEPETMPGFPSLESEQSRARRPLDEQFDMLELHEYRTESEEEEYNGSMGEENEYQESLAEKLNHAFKDHPSDQLHHDVGANDTELPEVAPDVILRCKEYAEKYGDENDEEVVFVEESSDESEKWDCETIISTYSTFDNHPGKIGAPETRRSKKLSETVSGVSAAPSKVIALKGKERLPVDFLPHNKKLEEKTKEEKDTKDEQIELPKWKPRGQESKEEKKERKSAVKSERREARQMKKEMRGLYKFESQRAQKVAAFTGPSSIHLM